MTLLPSINPKSSLYTGSPFIVYIIRFTCVSVSEETLKERGIISGKNECVKILGKGDVSVALKFEVAAVSKTAREKILAQGGEIIEHGKS